MIRSIFFIATIVCAPPVIAETFSCHFTKECQIGKRCNKISYDADFIKQESGDSYAIIADAALKASGVTMDFDGRMGTLVSKNPHAVTPYADYFVLSFSNKGAVLSRTGLGGDNMPDAVIFTGKCEGVN